METPGAQMSGKWEFDYSIIPGGRDAISSYAQAYAFAAPLRAVCTEDHPGSLPPAGSFVEVTPGEFVVSAVKQMENGNGWLVRGYNITGRMINVTLKPWRLHKLVERADLAETRQSDLKPAADGSVTVPVKGHEIVSVVFRD
jgi:alpha-mannosidase